MQPPIRGPYIYSLNGGASRAIPAAQPTRTRTTEKREADSGAHSPGPVQDEPDRHGRGHEPARHGLAFHWGDDEPGDERGEDGAEYERGEQKPRAVEPGERSREDRAPQSAPERN